jgi:FkbM family methyltransferase
VTIPTNDSSNRDLDHHQTQAPPVRFRIAKLVASSLLRSWPVRLATGLAFGDRGVPFRGTRIRVESRMSFAAPLLLAGKYERAEIDFIQRYLPRDLDVLELGASLGATSCQIAKHLQFGCQLTCVEANPTLIDILRGNLDRNAPGRQVNVIHAMVGAAVGTAYFSPRQDSLASIASEASPESVCLPCETVASLVLQHCPRDFALVSDIEGAEAAFLGDGDALDRCRLMIIEAHPSQLGTQELTLEEVIALPLLSGRWRICDRYGAVVAYQRC